MHGFDAGNTSLPSSQQQLSTLSRYCSSLSRYCPQHTGSCAVWPPHVATCTLRPLHANTCTLCRLCPLACWHPVPTDLPPPLSHSIMHGIILHQIYMWHHIAPNPYLDSPCVRAVHPRATPHPPYGCILPAGHPPDAPPKPTSTYPKTTPTGRRRILPLPTLALTPPLPLFPHLHHPYCVCVHVVTLATLSSMPNA